MRLFGLGNAMLLIDCLSLNTCRNMSVTKKVQKVL
jgi:hypothetical protein